MKQYKRYEIGPRLKQRSREMRLTQKYISNYCDISRSSLHRFFNGKYELNTTDFLNVILMLGLQLTEVHKKQGLDK